MKRYETWLVNGLLVIAVSSVLVLVCVAPPTNTSEAASWMQAICSVSALGVAIGVMQIQQRHERQLEAERRIDASAGPIENALAVLDRAASAAEAATHELRSGRSGIRYLNDEWPDSPAHHFHTVLGKFPLERIEDGLLQVRLLQATDALAKAIRVIGGAKPSGRREDSEWVAIAQKLAPHASTLRQAATAFKAARDAIRSSSNP